jgi:hypothetical protein
MAPATLLLSSLQDDDDYDDDDLFLPNHEIMQLPTVMHAPLGVDADLAVCRACSGTGM